MLEKVIDNQSVIETNLFKKTWRSLNCSPKTLKVIREIQENLRWHPLSVDVFLEQ